MLLLKLVPGSGFGFVKVLRNCHLYKLYKVKLHVVLLLSFFCDSEPKQEKKKSRRSGAGSRTGQLGSARLS